MPVSKAKAKAKRRRGPRGGDYYRYGRYERLLTLTLAMQGSHNGLTLKDIQERYGVKRRTSERWRDAIERVFKDNFQLVTGEHETPKRWRIKAGALRANFSAGELATVQRTIALLRSDNHPDVGVLDGVAAKIEALVPAEKRHIFEPDFEFLTAVEGLARHPGPHPKIRPAVLEPLREAMRAYRKVRISYRSRKDSAVRAHEVCPYGFLYGVRHYLVAGPINAEIGIPLLYALPNIEKVTVTERIFERPHGFSLKEFADRSFGVYQEKPFDVVWKFSPNVARDAREFLFHPTQTLKVQPDGSLIVRFHAGGLDEMAWHLFTWGGEVEVIAPRKLKDRLVELKRAGLNDVPTQAARKTVPPQKRR